MTSFDYLTLDDDIVQIKRGDHRRPAEGGRRPARQPPQADHRLPGHGEHRGRRRRRHQATPTTPRCCWSSSRRRRAARASRRRCCATASEVEMEKKGGRWLLSGIAGTGPAAMADSPTSAVRRPAPAHARVPAPGGAAPRPDAAAPRRRQPPGARGGRRGRGTPGRGRRPPPARSGRDAPAGDQPGPRRPARGRRRRRARRPRRRVPALVAGPRAALRRSRAAGGGLLLWQRLNPSYVDPSIFSPARSEVQALYAYDYKDSDGSVQRKLDVLTGDLRDQYKKDLRPGRDHRHLQAGVGDHELPGPRRRPAAGQRRAGHRDAWWCSASTW